MHQEAARESAGRVEERDAALLRRVTAADPAAYSELCDRYGLSLQRFAAARLGGDQQLAEEVAVQTLAAVVASAGRLRHLRTTLSAWVYGVARREVQREIRKQSRRKSVPAASQVPLEAVTEIAARQDEVADSLAQLDAQRLLRTLAQVLSETEFEVLVLSSLGELSAGEIGQAIGRSTRAVHSLLHRAKRKARERVVRDAG